jgi:hypothetical protein
MTLAASKISEAFPRLFHELIALLRRDHPLAETPKKHDALVKPCVRGASVLVMSNELDGILGNLPSWFSDRQPHGHDHAFVRFSHGPYVVTDEPGRECAVCHQREVPGENAAGFVRSEFFTRDIRANTDPSSAGDEWIRAHRPTNVCQMPRTPSAG